MDRREEEGDNMTMDDRVTLRQAVDFAMWIAREKGVVAR